MKILMLGNSFTAVNKMPEKLAKLTGASVFSHTRGGARLTEHLNPKTAMGEKTLEALEKEHWDYVVLQEMSKAPITTKAKFLETVSLLCEKIRACGAEPVLFATWAYKKGGDRMEDMPWTYEEMAQGLHDAYCEAAEHNHAILADAGSVFLVKSKTEDLYAPDGRHPNEKGSSLAAEVIAEAILADHRNKEAQRLTEPEADANQKSGSGKRTKKKASMTDVNEEKAVSNAEQGGEYITTVDTINRKDDRLRVLYLYQILDKYSDQEHPLTTKQLQQYMMEEHQIHLHRTTVPEYVELLREAGIAIHGERKRSFVYYLEGRTFSVPELKLLIDAVQASRFITDKKTEQLIGKLMEQASDSARDKLVRSLHTTGKIKTDNELIYQIVDQINEAINQAVKITFYYFDFNIHKKKILKNDGAPYTVSPFDLIWDGDYYYLTGFCDERGEIRTFRVDRILSVPELLPESAVRKGRGYHVEHYTQEAFRMYSTQNVDKVNLRCDSTAMKAVIDQFGPHVRTKMLDEEHFQATVKVCAGPTFYRWIFGFSGAISITGPENLREEYRKMLETALAGL